MVGQKIRQIKEIATLKNKTQETTMTTVRPNLKLKKNRNTKS